MKSSLVIVSFFIIGTLVGVSGIVPECVASGTDVGFYALCALMFFVGVSVGGDSSVLGRIRSVSPRLLLLPFVTVAGTLGGVAVAGMLLPNRSLADCLAVGSGFGYYSLSSIFITEYRGAELLAPSPCLQTFHASLLTLLCAPLLVRWFGKVCADFGRRSDNNGYYTACHHAL